jgi:hypothetical protein
MATCLRVRPTGGFVLLVCLVSILLSPCRPARGRDFVRGRINGDAQVDISDAVYGLNYLFLGAPRPDCLKALDVDDDGITNITDPIYLLNFLFVGGKIPPQPYPNPGPDPTPDDLTCGDQTVTNLTAAPDPVNFNQLGQTSQLVVTGQVGGSTVDLTAASTGTTYASNQPGVAFVYRDGRVEAKGIGSATVSIGNGTAETSVSVQVTATGASDRHRILAVNDLGMHCIDREFSIYSILPPFNVVHAQVVERPISGKPRLLDDTSVIVRYSPVVDALGSVNSTSVGKTSFWEHVLAAYGADLPPGQGLLGLYMPDDAPDPGPQLVPYSAASGWFGAGGIPIIDRDDAGEFLPFPLLRMSAFDKTTGAYLAHTDIVLPVSSETDCQNCHATGKIAARDPGVDWATDLDLELQTKKNVLILHDNKLGTDLQHETPVLCARCHYSPALDLAGTGPQGDQIGKPTFSSAMHDFHGTRVDGQGLPVFPPSGDAASTCYQCHPGAQTRCLRGAMANAGMECKDCHGGMRAVGGAFPLAAGGSLDGQNDGGSRRPWKDLPRCQSCHTGDAVSHLTGADLRMAPDGIRLTQAYRTGDEAASPILATNKRFAENSNTLFRFSKGHSGVLCENCHGSTHAEWPHANPASNDNVAANQLQGHTGKLQECVVCHSAGTLALTTGGPHNMHNVNDPRWTDGGHESFYESNPALCKACHGADLLGTPLSRTAAARTYQVEEGTVTVAKGTAIKCNLCHGLPGTDG